MMRWVRPVEPGNFRARVADSEGAVAAIASFGPPSSKDFKPVWQPWKKYFIEAQHDRCGYCDLPLSGHGDVEHYRPKAGLEDLPLWTPAERKRPNARFVSDWAWWWLAYNWSNYLAACERCNQIWKANLFPVSGGHTGAPARGVSQVPLLLNPFDGPHPEAHLTFDRVGVVSAQAGSPYGLATIRTCGLYRIDLIEKRYAAADAAHRFMAGLDHVSRDLRERALLDIGRAGSVRTPLASVMRCIWRSKTEIAWRDSFETAPDGWDQPLREVYELVVGV